MNATVLCLMAGMVLILNGCATTHYTINKPISTIEASAGHRLSLADKPNDKESMFIHMSFSGGGIRAAAFAYGVMEELRASNIVWQGRVTTLWNEVNVISAVSGGSLTAGFVAAHGDNVFEDFVPKVLEGKIQTQIVSDTLSLGGLWRLGSPRFGRSDVLERRLDKDIFDGMSYNDIAMKHKKPFVIISATEMHTGQRFEFTQDSFDQLCSDLGSLPLARAVAASSAAPIVLSPVTLWNYAPGCQQVEATALLPKNYLHLVDGGLSDNLAARALLDINEKYGVANVARNAGYRNLSRVVFILVNAETSTMFPEDKNADVPSMVRSGLALADIPINHYSVDTRKQLVSAMEKWQQQARQSAMDSNKDFTFASDATFYLIEVNLRDAPDDALKQISTSLELDSKTTFTLRTAAREQLKKSTEFCKLMKLLQTRKNSSMSVSANDCQH
jgi:NTE family protein